MYTMSYIAPVVGILIMIIGTFTAAFALLFRTVEVKRVIALAGILFFCSVFLVLYERVTILELPASLGKITVQAKTDAKEIRKIRINMEASDKIVGDIVGKVSATADHVSTLSNDIEAQQKTVSNLVSQIKEASSRITSLAKETESGLSKLHESQSTDRKQYLRDQLAELRNRTHGLRVEYSQAMFNNDTRKMVKIFSQQAFDNNKKERFVKELKKIEDEHQSN